VIQPGKRTRRSALLVAAALSISGTVLAQTPPPAPEPAPAAPPADPTPEHQPANPPAPPAPGPPPAAPQQPIPVKAPEPPATTLPTMAGPALRLSQMFTFRPGLLFQLWGSFAQELTQRCRVVLFVRGASLDTRPTTTLQPSSAVKAVRMVAARLLSSQRRAGKPWHIGAPA